MEKMSCYLVLSVQYKYSCIMMLCGCTHDNVRVFYYYRCI